MHYFQGTTSKRKFENYYNIDMSTKIIQTNRKPNVLIIWTFSVIPTKCELKGKQYNQHQKNYIRTVKTYSKSKLYLLYLSKHSHHNQYSDSKPNQYASNASHATIHC